MDVGKHRGLLLGRPGSMCWEAGLGIEGIGCIDYMGCWTEGTEGGLHRGRPSILPLPLSVGC